MFASPSSSLGSFLSPDPRRLDDQVLANNVRFESSAVDGRSSNRILWIDDEVQPTDALVRLIQQEGFRVECASTGDLGLDLARRSDYQVILLDLRLTAGSGLDVLRRLRETGVASPVVMLTGFADVESAVAAMKLGAVDYREKPMDAEDLAALLRSACASWSAAPDRNSGDAWFRSRIDALAACTTRTDLLAVILGLLADRRLSLRAFFGCADVLRLLLRNRDDAFDELRSLSRRAMASAASSPLPDHPRLRRMVGRLERDGALHTDKLDTGLSRFHASHLMSKQTGRTLSEWRNAAVLREAARKAIDGDEKVASIALDAGYSNPGQFVRQFRTMFGVTPGRMRTLWMGISQSGPLTRNSSGS